MSGRVRWERDGKTVVGYRKTDRRQTKRPFRELLREVVDTGPEDLKARIAFLLPKTLLVANGPNGPGVTVLARGFVRIVGHSSEQCFGLARDFFQVVARDRPAFTAFAVIASADYPDLYYGRYLTVVSGSLVISSSEREPLIFEARPG